ncbi:MAG: hypothetical protein AAFV93_16210, partial [Chloroflexota bacterium]
MQQRNESMTQSFLGDLTLGTILARIAAYILLTFFGFLMIFPFLYMLSTSFKTSDDVFRFPPALLPFSQETLTVDEEELLLYEFEINGETVELVSTGENTRFGFFSTQEQINVDDVRSSEIAIEIPLDDATETGEVLILQNSEGEDEEFDIYQVPVDGETVELLLAYRGAKTLFVD